MVLSGITKTKHISHGSPLSSTKNYPATFRRFLKFSILKSHHSKGKMGPLNTFPDLNSSNCETCGTPFIPSIPPAISGGPWGSVMGTHQQILGAPKRPLPLSFPPALTLCGDLFTEPLFMVLLEVPVKESLSQCHLCSSVWHHLALLALPLAVAGAMRDGDSQIKRQTQLSLHLESWWE